MFSFGTRTSDFNNDNGCVVVVACIQTAARSQAALGTGLGVSVGYDTMEARKAPLGDSLIQLLELNTMQKPVYCIQIMSMDAYLRLGESCLFIGIPGWFFSQPCSFTIEKAWRFIVKSG